MTNLSEGHDDPGGAAATEAKSESRPSQRPRKASSHANGSSSAATKLPALADVKSSIEDVTSRLRDLPQLIEQQTRENPYRALGVAAGVGFGVGAIMSSRILRLMLVTAGGYAVNELARGRIKAFIDEIEAKANETT